MVKQEAHDQESHVSIHQEEHGKFRPRRKPDVTNFIGEGQCMVIVQDDCPQYFRNDARFMGDYVPILVRDHAKYGLVLLKNDEPCCVFRVKRRLTLPRETLPIDGPLCALVGGR